MRNPKINIGDKFTDVEGFTCVVVEYVDSNKIKVEYEDGYTQYRSSTRLRKAFHKGGRGGNRGKRSVSSKPSNRIKMSPVVKNLKEKHDSILKRLFRDSYKQKNLAYSDGTISEEWMKFESFSSWAQNQVGHERKDWHIDKDILVKGNKHYGPETCCFVPLRINILFTSRAAKRGPWPIGVHQNNKSLKYISKCRDGARSVNLGSYSTPEEAFNAYKVFKEKVIKGVAEEYKSIIDPRVYEAMIAYRVEITD